MESGPRVSITRGPPALGLSCELTLGCLSMLWVQEKSEPLGWAG